MVAVKGTLDEELSLWDRLFKVGKYVGDCVAGNWEVAMISNDKRTRQITDETTHGRDKKV